MIRLIALDQITIYSIYESISKSVDNSRSKILNSNLTNLQVIRSIKNSLSPIFLTTLGIKNIPDINLNQKLQEIKHAMEIEAVKRIKEMGLQFTYKYYDKFEQISNKKLLENLKNVGKLNLIPKINQNLLSKFSMGIDGIKFINDNIKVIVLISGSN